MSGAAAASLAALVAVGISGTGMYFPRLLILTIPGGEFSSRKRGRSRIFIFYLLCFTASAYLAGILQYPAIWYRIYKYGADGSLLFFFYVCHALVLTTRRPAQELLSIPSSFSSYPT